MTGTTPIYFFVTNGDNCHWDFPKKKKHPTYHYFNKVHHSGWRFLHHSEKKNSNLNLPMAASVIVGRWPLVIITIIIITMDPNIPKQKCKCVLYMSNGNEPFQSQFVFTYTHKSNKQNQIFFCWPFGYIWDDIYDDDDGSCCCRYHSFTLLVCLFDWSALKHSVPFIHSFGFIVAVVVVDWLQFHTMKQNEWMNSGDIFGGQHANSHHHHGFQIL